MTEHKIVSQEEWLEARKALLAREKEETRLRDAVNAERRALPWVRVEQNYEFETPQGLRSLGDLFNGRRQLVVYHFMLAPDWEEGCTGCSFVADHFDGALAHLNAAGVSFLAVSRAGLSQIEAFRKRMGWQFPWISSQPSNFNRDFGVTFTPEDIASGTAQYNYTAGQRSQIEPEKQGLSAFYKGDDGSIFHTYSSYARGIEELIGTFMILDRAPLGRNETSTMNWVRLHDTYSSAAAPASCCHS